LKTYQHLFFDLDHTLWDHETNAHQSLEEVYQYFKLHDLGIDSVSQFQQTFRIINEQLWKQYERNQISSDKLRHARFRLIFDKLGVKNHILCDTISDYYLDICPRKSSLMPSAMEVLEYLAPKYPMHLITNGFSDIQGLKTAAGGITHFFGEVITSQRAGEKKPNRQIFDFALKTAGAKAYEALMIGDNPEADVIGAMSAGIDAVWFNPNSQGFTGKPTYEIQNLSELMSIL
jgi:YjjG family noncanonical pyrimidine nucleotidase